MIGAVARVIRRILGIKKVRVNMDWLISMLAVEILATVKNSLRVINDDFRTWKKTEKARG